MKTRFQLNIESCVAGNRGNSTTIHVNYDVDVIVDREIVATISASDHDDTDDAGANPFGDAEHVLGEHPAALAQWEARCCEIGDAAINALREKMGSCDQ